MFKCDWPECPSEWEQPELAAEFETLRSVRAVCNKALDIARSEKAIRSSLEASVTITTDSPHLFSLLTKHEEDAHGNEFPLQDILIVSGLTLNSGSVSDTIISTNENRSHSYVEFVRCGEEECKVQVMAESADLASHKCPRCWKYTSSVEDSLCERCTSALKCL